MNNNSISEPTATGSNNRIRVHITKRHVIWLDNAACDQLDLRDRRFVRVLCWEPYNEMMIIPDHAEGRIDPYLFEIKPMRDNGMIIIANDFIESLATKRRVIGRYRSVWDDVYHMLRINLNERLKKNG